jgi:hypothetical protein
MELEPRKTAEEVATSFRMIEKEILAFVNGLRDKLDDAMVDVQKARDLAKDALDDARENIAPALGQGPLDEFDATAKTVDSFLGDAEDAIEAARDACYDDFDLDDVQEADCQQGID